MRNWWDAYFKLAGLILVLLLIIFDNTLGLVYTLMLFVTWIWHKSDRAKTYKLVNNSQRLGKIAFEALVAFGLFTVIANVLVQAVVPGTYEGFQSIFNLLATSTPILQGSKLLTLAGWGGIIPVVETILFFVIVLEGVAEWYAKASGKRFSLTKFSLPMVFVMLVVSSLFTVFHLTAKQLATIPLLITFVFAMVSCALVIHQKDARGAIILHILTNSVAVIAGVF